MVPKESNKTSLYVYDMIEKRCRNGRSYFSGGPAVIIINEWSIVLYHKQASSWECSPTAMDSESNGWVLFYMVSARTMTHRLLHIQRLYRISNPPIREQLVWESFPRMARIHTPAQAVSRCLLGGRNVSLFITMLESQMQNSQLSIFLFFSSFSFIFIHKLRSL